MLATSCQNPRISVCDIFIQSKLGSHHGLSLLCLRQVRPAQMRWKARQVRSTVWYVWCWHGQWSVTCSFSRDSPMGPQCPLKMSAEQGPRVEIAKMQISPRGWKWKGRISDAGGPGAGRLVVMSTWVCPCVYTERLGPQADKSPKSPAAKGMPMIQFNGLLGYVSPKIGL